MLTCTTIDRSSGKDIDFWSIHREKPFLLYSVFISLCSTQAVGILTLGPIHIVGFSSAGHTMETGLNV